MTDENLAYVYALISPDGQPFYIGCSTKADYSEKSFKKIYKRPFMHHINSILSYFNKKESLTKKEKYIADLLSANKKIGVKIIKEHLSITEARILEKKYIAELGKIIDGGILFNETCGGETPNVTDETRLKISHSTRKRFIDDPELNKKYSERAKNLWQDKEYKKKISESCKNFYNVNPERRLKISREAKLRWKDEDYRKRCLNENNFFTSETALKANQIAYQKCPQLREISRNNLIKYNKSEQGRNESRNRAKHMRDIFNNLSENDKELAILKRKIGAYLPRYDGTKRLRVDELTIENISKSCLDFLRKIYVLDSDYIKNKITDEKLLDEISK